MSKTSKANKLSAHPKIAKEDGKKRTDRSTATFSSLADLRSLYQELKAEAALAPPAPSVVKGGHAKQSLSRAAQSPSPSVKVKSKSETPALAAFKEDNWLQQAKQLLSMQSQRRSPRRFDPRLSDDYEPVLAYYADGAAYFCKPGVGSDIARKMQQGPLNIQAQIDLHGMRLDEARGAMTEFVQVAVEEELRCVRVIHGKGLGSINQKPALKGRVYAWLAQLEEVLSFRQAPPREGGAGATIVLLRASRRLASYTR